MSSHVGSGDELQLPTDEQIADLYASDPQNNAQPDLEKKLRQNIRDMIKLEYAKPDVTVLVMGDERNDVTPQELEDDLSLALSRYFVRDILPPLLAVADRSARIDEVEKALQAGAIRTIPTDKGNNVEWWPDGLCRTLNNRLSQLRASPGGGTAEGASEAE